jgi:CheY-like chemotaxis protein
LVNEQNPYEISNGKHVMLLYGKDEDRTEAAAHWINQALDDEQLCIYASVYAFDRLNISSISNLSTKIKNYQEHVENNNLQIINFRPYYDSALGRNLVLFENLKSNLEKLLCDLVVKGKKDKIIVFADAACCLCENRSFGESEILEKWWQEVHNEWVKNNYNITVICPHPQLMLQREQDTKSKIANLHDIMLDLNNYDLDHLSTRSGRENDIRILIVESDPDLMILYTEFLGKNDIDVVVTSEGNECLSLVKQNVFDIVILDTHLSGTIESIDVAKEIYRINPGQRIVLTTTNPLYRTTAIDNYRVKNEDILVKPFMLSNLLDVIERKYFFPSSTLH